MINDRRIEYVNVFINSGDPELTEYLKKVFINKCRKRGVRFNFAYNSEDVFKDILDIYNAEYILDINNNKYLEEFCIKTDKTYYNAESLKSILIADNFPLSAVKIWPELLTPKMAWDILGAYYPVSVHRDRYSGTYSGGEWIAFAMISPPPEIFDNDVACAKAWGRLKSETPNKFGVGNTPDEAVINLVLKQLG